jgi:hypothetical protein
MKTRITDYVFTPGGSGIGSVKLPTYQTVTLDSFLLITNVTSNVIIYNFSDPTAGGTVNGNVLTFVYDTSTMSSTDKLLIYYDDPVNLPATDNTANLILQLAQAQVDSVALLKRIAEFTSNLEVTDSSNRLRVNVETAVVSSCTMAANQLIRPTDALGTALVTLNGVGNSNMYVVPDTWKFLDVARSNFSIAMRPLLTFN